jgi:hypothetical protein
MNRADARRAGTALNHLSFENNLNVLLFPVGGHLFQHLIHVMRVYQKLAGCNSAASANACGYDNVLIGIRVYQPGHNRIILVGFGLVLL